MSHRISSRLSVMDRFRRILSVGRPTVAVRRRHARSLEVLEARIAPAAALGATKVAVFAAGGDVNGDGKYQPGDTILYTVTITNNGDVDLTGVTFNDIIDSNTNLGQVNVSPLALDDTFTAVANTLLEVGVTHGAFPAAQVAGSVTGNDVEFQGDAQPTLSKLQAVSFSGGTATATSAQGGSVTMDASGHFTYLPAVGFTGQDSFTYTITDDGLDNNPNTPDDNLTSVGTVKITVGTQKVWYVNNSAAAGGDGRSTSPFNALTATNLNGPGGVGDVDGANDIIFLHNGTGAAYTSGLGLEAGQTLHGEGTALVVGGFNLVAAGTLPKIANPGGIAVNLSTDNKLRGFSATDAATSISGTSFNTLDVLNVTIANTTAGAGLSLTTGSFVTGAQFNSISSAGGLHGIALTGVNSTGAVDLGGNSGPGLTGATGSAFFVSGGNAALSYGGAIASSSTGHSVDIDSHSTGNITISSASLTDTGTGISITNNTSGTISFTGTAKVINTGANTGITFTGNGANLFLGNTGNIGVTTTTGTGINASGNTGTLTIGGPNNSITTTTGQALNVVNTPIGAGGLTFQSITAGTASAGPASGIVLTNTGTAGGLTVTGNGTANSGGVIQHTSSHGIALTNVSNISLTRVLIRDTGDHGIFGDGVNNFTFQNSTIFNFGNATPSSGTSEDGMHFESTNTANTAAGHGLTGTVIIKSSTIGTDGHFTLSPFPSLPENKGIVIRNHNDTALNMTVTGTTFTQISNDGIDAEITGGAGNLVVDGSTGDGANVFNQINGRAITYSAPVDNTSDQTLELTVKNNTFSNVGIAARWLASARTTVNARFLNNNSGSNVVTNDAIRSESDATTPVAGHPATVNATISGNNMGGGSIFISNHRGALANISFVNNTNIGGTAAGVGGSGSTGVKTGINVFSDRGSTINIDLFGNTATADGGPTQLQSAISFQTSNNGGGRSSISAFIGGSTAALKNTVSEVPDTGGQQAISLDTVGGQGDIFLEGWNGSSPTYVAFLTNNNTINATVKALADNPAFVKAGTGRATIPALPLAFAASADDTVAIPQQPGSPSGGGSETTGGGSTGPASPGHGGAVIVDDGVLSQAELDSLVGAAKLRWIATGLSAAQVATLNAVTFSVADLPGWYLGEASPGHITLDSNAAGNSWFIDPTPNDDSEFAGSHATATGGAAGRIDALTTVMHELGHQLGLDDSYVSSDSGNLMYGYIHQSERRLPTAHQADGATPHLVQGDLDFATVPVTIGSLPVGKSVRIDFTAQIVANPSANTISNQGSVYSDQGGQAGTMANPILTDGDAVTPGQQPTITLIALPEVNLAIGTTTSVAEDGGGNLVYTFTRQSPLTNSLTVNFTVSGGAVFTGNAAGDTDYTQSGAATFSGTTGSVTFAANSATATVTITPHADTATEPDETVVLTLASGAGYSVASTGSTFGSGTITNDDTTVFVTGTPGSVAEDSGSTLTYIFKRNGLIASALDVHLHLAGSATFIADYGQSGATSYNDTDAFVHFNPGSDTATIVLTPTPDSTVEADETIQMTIVADAGYNVDAVNNSLTGTITNDDATVSVAIQAPGSIAEDAAGFLTYTFTRTGFTANAATVNFTASGSATKDVDYGVNGASFIGLAGTVTFAPGSTTATVTVDPTADANGEPDETVIFTINAGTGYSPDVTPNEHATGTILNDDTSVSVAVTGSPISEAATGGAHLTYTFTRSGDNSTPLTINFSAGGSASFANDYVLTGANSFSTSSGLGTLTFAANSSTATVTVTPTNDTLVEGDEQAAIFVNTGPGYGVGSSPALGTITDNETATISFVLPNSSTPEFNTPHVVDVKLVTFSPEGTASLQNDFTVYVQDTTVPGIGVATGSGVDYTFNEQALIFHAGDTGSTKTVSATIINDTISEGNETFRLGLSATSGSLAPFAPVGLTPAVTIDSNPHTVTIVDNDVDVHVTADGPAGSVLAGSGTGNIGFNFTVQNTGLTDATSIDLTELFNLPAGVTFSSSAPSGSTTFDGVHWFIPALAVNATETLSVYLTADHSTAGGASVSTNMTATLADQDLVNTGDDFAASSASIARQSDLHLTKTASPDPVGTGGQLTYTITVHNNGPSDATSASVTDLLPTQFANATWITSLNGVPGAGGSGDVNATTSIPADGDFVITVTGTVNANSNTSFSNTASVNSSEETNFMDNSDTATTFVGGVDLKLTKQADLALVTPSTTGNDHILTYTLTYRNGGFITAEGVRIDDVIPANTVFDAAHSSPGWLDATNNPLVSGATGSIHYAVGELPVSPTGTPITLAVKVNAGVSAGATTVDNAADISDDGTGGADLMPGDNHATASSTLAAAPDLHLTQAADRLQIIRGQTLHTSYTYANDGNQDATGVTIVAHVPTGTTFDAGQSGGLWISLGGGDFQLNVGAVPAHGSGTVVFAVDVSTTRVAGLHEVDTTATVDDGGINGPDPTPANNTATNAAALTRIYEGIYVVSQGIAVPGKFGTPTVHVYDPIDGHQIYQFDAYESNYRDSVRVAVADINGDGFDDIITTTGKGTGRLRVFDGLNGTWLHDEASYTGPFKNEIAVFSGKGLEKGAFVAAGDLTGDGRADIVVGSALGGSKVRVLDGFTGAAQLFGTADYFQPFGKTFRGGVRVAVADVLGDSRADLAVGMGFYGAQVKVYDANALGGPKGLLFAPLVVPVPVPVNPLAAIDFKVGAKTYRGGVSVALGDLDGDNKADLIIGRNWTRPTIVETFSGVMANPDGSPKSLGAPIVPFDKNPARPVYGLGVRVGVIDINFDGIVDIITASGGLNKSTVNVYDGAGHALLRTFTAIPTTPNSALFTAGTSKMPVVQQVMAP